MSTYAYIQIQDFTKNWLTINVIEAINDQYIRGQMQLTKAGYPNKRVRAITKEGALIDLME